MATRCSTTLKFISTLTRPITTNPSTSKLVSSFTTSTEQNVKGHDKLPESAAPWLRLPCNINIHSTRELFINNFLNIVDKRLVKLNENIMDDAEYNIIKRDYNLICAGSTRGTLVYLSEGGQSIFDGAQSFFVNPYTASFTKMESWYMDNADRILHSSTRNFTQAGEILTVLCNPWHDLDSWTPLKYREFFVSSPSSKAEWSRHPYLFQKDDPPLAYCDETRTAYKLSTDSNHRLHIELWSFQAKCIEVESRFYIETSSRSMEASEQELRMRCHQDRYLVVTKDSDKADPVLYLVVRHHNSELGTSETRAVDVFKIDLDKKRMTYTTTLDDHAFFIGRGSEPFAISVKECPELKPNSVYISDDLRVFDLRDRSITPFVEMGDLYMTRLQTFWIAPPLMLSKVERSPEYESESEGC